MHCFVGITVLKCSQYRKLGNIRECTHISVYMCLCACIYLNLSIEKHDFILVFSWPVFVTIFSGKRGFHYPECVLICSIPVCKQSLLCYHPVLLEGALLFLYRSGPTCCVPSPPIGCSPHHAWSLMPPTRELQCMEAWPHTCPHTLLIHTSSATPLQPPQLPHQHRCGRLLCYTPLSDFRTELLGKSGK